VHLSIALETEHALQVEWQVNGEHAIGEPSPIISPLASQLLTAVPLALRTLFDQPHDGLQPVHYREIHTFFSIE
jgi:hypothetical protein